MTLRFVHNSVKFCFITQHNIQCRDGGGKNVVLVGSYSSHAVSGVLLNDSTTIFVKTSKINNVVESNNLLNKNVKISEWYSPCLTKRKIYIYVYYTRMLVSR